MNEKLKLKFKYGGALIEIESALNPSGINGYSCSIRFISSEIFPDNLQRKFSELFEDEESALNFAYFVNDEMYLRFE